MRNGNAIWQQLRLDLVSINMYANSYQNIPYGSRVMGNFHFFTVWTSAKPPLMENGIWQSGLDLVNINVYAEFDQTIPCGSRDRASFTFSEFGPWQSLDQRK